MKKSITILAPAYNEAANLPTFVESISRISVEKLSEYEVELLIVNDGSRDNTIDVLLELRRKYSFLNVLNLSRNFGKENALLAGIDYADGDCVIIIDSDNQHPADVIPLMVKEWEAGYDDVYGKRCRRTKESFVRRRLSLTYYKLLQHTTRIDILPNVGDFRLLDRRCINILRELRETQRYNKGLFAWIGFKKKPIPYDDGNRTNGKSKFSLTGLLHLAIEGITSFTTAPLRFATLMGMAVSLTAFLYLIVVLVKTIVWGESVRGYPTLLCVILILGGCQLLALGIIGEYVGRIFNESKGRPPYIAESLNGEKISTLRRPSTGCSPSTPADEKPNVQENRHDE